LIHRCSGVALPLLSMIRTGLLKQGTLRNLLQVTPPVGIDRGWGRLATWLRLLLILLLPRV
jgi:hypothetical protein